MPFVRIGRSVNKARNPFGDVGKGIELRQGGEKRDNRDAPQQKGGRAASLLWEENRSQLEEKKEKDSDQAALREKKRSTVGIN